MKKLSKIKLSNLAGSSQMSDAEMKQVTGGSTQKEYCCSLWNIASYNTLEGGAAQGWWYGWSTHCSGFSTSDC
ncbi:MAG: TIGR04149 family rSAM-modified RiPP [Dysgonamonadaceae bacterium]|jgi:natural product precursor|nr:TIGR04149 family rSAM-modified RiPP [Dysgonamonadaceae bacterium]